MCNIDVAKSFANGGKPCKVAHMSHDGECLYSYKATIAKKVNDVFLINTRDGWSQTTKRHIGLVMRACYPNYIIVYDVLKGKDYNILGMKNNIRHLFKKRRNARTMKKYYKNLILLAIRDLRQYKEL